jgi:hypothetical protein
MFDSFVLLETLKPPSSAFPKLIAELGEVVEVHQSTIEHRIPPDIAVGRLGSRHQLDDEKNERIRLEDVSEDGSRASREIS